MSESRQKTDILMVRVTPEERAELAGRAVAAGLSTPELLRRSALSRRVDPQARATAEALRELSRVGQNLNQLTRLSHMGEYNQNDVSQTLAEVRAAAARVAGTESSR
jgi:hypothetical protein